MKKLFSIITMCLISILSFSQTAITNPSQLRTNQLFQQSGIDPVNKKILTTYVGNDLKGIVVECQSLQSQINNPASAWSLLGNTGTTAGTNFIGTGDAQDLVIKTNSAEFLRFKSSGMFGADVYLDSTFNRVFYYEHSGKWSHSLQFIKSVIGGMRLYSTDNGTHTSLVQTDTSGVTLDNVKIGTSLIVKVNSHYHRISNNLLDTTIFGNHKQYFNVPLQIKDGTQAANKVLTSDASGNGHWGDSLRLGLGSVGHPTYASNTYTTTGMYFVSGTQLGFSVGGQLKGGFNTVGLFTNAISEQTTGFGISLMQTAIQLRTATTFTASSTVGADTLIKGLLVVSTGTPTITLPTATDLITNLGLTKGTSFSFMVQDTAVVLGGNCTIALNTGIVQTGLAGAVQNLVVPASATVGIGKFEIAVISVSPPAAIIQRIY